MAILRWSNLLSLDFIYDVVDQYKSILKIDNKEEFLIQATEFIDQIDGDKLSLQEAKKMESLGKTQKDLIAPISQRDDRYIYNRRVIGKEKRKELQKLRSSLSPEENTVKSIEKHTKKLN